MKKIMTHMLIILMFMLLVTGCKENSVKHEEALDSLMYENTVITEKIENLSNRVGNLETNKEMLLKLIDEQVTILSGKLDDDYTALPIYNLDINTDKLRVQYYVMIQKGLLLEKKVKTLADKLSIYSFDGLPIELLRIESLDGTSIAVINFIDPEDRIKSGYRKTWANFYFQGSSGGNATATKLLRTFLQEDFKGEWIDGVKFLYNNEETNNFEHVGELLGGIHYRN